MKKIISILSLAVVLTAAATNASAQKLDELKFYDVRELGLPLLNQGFKDCVRPDTAQVAQEPVNDGYYTRLAASAESKVRKPVWNLAQNSTGIAVRFRTDSKTIGLKWTLISNFRMNHMTAAGICGFDLYGWDGQKWRFVGLAQPSGKNSATIMRKGMYGTMREYMMYFPLYDGVCKVEIGVDSTAVLEQPCKLGANLLGGQKDTKPLVFYGTSVTQGGCASRPGMVYTSILSRWLGRECINLGFSGNGRMDPELADEIARIDAGAYILDCLGNCSVQAVQDNTEYFIKTIAEAHPDVPVILLSNYPYMYDWVYYNPEAEPAQYEPWNGWYQKFKDWGYDNVQFIEIAGTHNPEDTMEGSATGPDNEAAVDGTHLTDLGFWRMAEFMLPYMKEIE